MKPLCVLPASDMRLTRLIGIGSSQKAAPSCRLIPFISRASSCTLPSRSLILSPRHASPRYFSSDMTRHTPPPPTPSTTVSPSTSAPPYVLVYGGNGSLGQSMVSAFRAASWRTISVDYYDNSEADHNIQLSHANDWKTNTEVVTSSLIALASALADDLPIPHPSSSPSPTPYLSAVVSVAGGWKGSTISSPALFDSTDVMLQSNVLSSLSSSHIASLFLLPSSLLLLTGAAAATASGTPSMIAYGLSKAAVHHLTLSLSAHDSELTERGVRVACLLPVTIDTPQNRQVMRTEDYSDWTPVGEFARCAVAWAEETEAGKRGREGRKQSRGAEGEKGEETKGEARRMKHGAVGGERGSGIPALVHGGFFHFVTSQNATSVKLLDNPLALGKVVAQ